LNRQTFVAPAARLADQESFNLVPRLTHQQPKGGITSTHILSKQRSMCIMSPSGHFSLRSKHSVND